MKDADKVAYVRFVSVYRQFDDIGEFQRGWRDQTRRLDAEWIGVVMVNGNLRLAAVAPGGQAVLLDALEGPSTLLVVDSRTWPSWMQLMSSNGS